MNSPTVLRRSPLLIALLAFLLTALLMSAGAGRASAIATQVNLGTASSFAVVAYSTVTNTGPSIISGDIGLDPGSAVTGFPPGTQVAGATYVSVPLSLQARSAASSAFTSASGQPGPAAVGVELGGSTLTPDLYESGGVLTITGDLTLDGLGDPNAVFVFRSTATLVTASASRVLLINNANPCNVFWIVPSSATLGAASAFVGTVIASDSIAANTGTNVTGRLFALNGAVTLDSTTVTSTVCTAAAVPAAPDAGVPGAGGTLPRTGGVSVPLLIVGLLTVAGGMALVLARRRLSAAA